MREFSLLEETSFHKFQYIRVSSSWTVYWIALNLILSSDVAIVDEESFFIGRQTEASD